VREDREEIVAEIATLPGERTPSLTGHAIECLAVSRNRAPAYGGNLASAATPSTVSMTLRADGVALALLTIFTTTGIVASRPTRSVLVSTRSRNVVSPFVNFTAFARSIRCGKSTFHACGGTYGHFVM